MTQKKHSDTGLKISGALTMADAEEFERKSEEWAREVTKNQETARAALVRIGIITPDGNLTERYTR